MPQETEVTQVPLNPLCMSYHSSDTVSNAIDVLQMLEAFIADRGGGGGFNPKAWNGLCLTLECVRSSVEHAKHQIESERRRANGNPV